MPPEKYNKTFIKDYDIRGCMLIYSNGDLFRFNHGQPFRTFKNEPSEDFEWWEHGRDTDVKNWEVVTSELPKELFEI